jgi:hypothetical protein
MRLNGCSLGLGHARANESQRERCSTVFAAATEGDYIHGHRDGAFGETIEVKLGKVRSA